MESLLDLDAAASALKSRRDVWTQEGFEVGPLTWRDQAGPWPWMLNTLRSDIRDPFSVGIEIKHANIEGRVVLFRGGWADVELLDVRRIDEVIDEAPNVPDLKAFDEVLDHFSARLLALRAPPS